jgi:hypothetical protein
MAYPPRKVIENAMGRLDKYPVDRTAAASAGDAGVRAYGAATTATDGTEADKTLRQQAFIRLREVIRHPFQIRLEMFFDRPLAFGANG